jgi:FlaA1/EpsC-like NDP-sugar epimerase
VLLVTGAGGSIGSELCRQVCRFGARQLLLVERAEFALFEIDRELRSAGLETEIVPLIADVGDESRVRAILSRYRPEVLVHAAAHKHVPLMELNPCEAIKNNVAATHLLARLAADHGVESFVQISTDKAVRPTSIMGASKRLAELLIQGLDRKHETRFVSVRFGNVLGSAGSVIPIFRDQIARGGPVTVTHPDMVRYFMTIPEAAQLVLQAGAMGEGGEIFVLDMGEPVRILDVAKDMIRLSGLRPFEDIDIVFSGIRPGEKLFEELQTDHEAIAATSHPKIFVGKIKHGPNDLIRESSERLEALAAVGDDAMVESILRRCLAEVEGSISPR